MSTPQTPSSGRESNGQFAKGNFGGPGNPYARQSAKLRQALLDNVSAAQIAAIITTMADLAIKGNVQAAKLVLHYTISKPTEAVNPDRLDQEEFDAYKEGHGMFAESTKMIQEPDSSIPVSVLRSMRWINHDKAKDALLTGMRLQDEREGIVRDVPLGTPITNGENGDLTHLPPQDALFAAPIRNGSNGERIHLAPRDEVPAAPIGNGSNGDHKPPMTEKTPIGNGPNGNGALNSARLAAVPAQKLSSRALRKLRKAVKRAELLSSSPSKNGR